MRHIVKIAVLVFTLGSIISCKNAKPEDKSSELSSFLKKVINKYEHLENHSIQFTFGDASPTSVFFGENKTFEIFTNAGGCTTGTCPMTRLKTKNNILYQEMLGHLITSSVDKNPIATIQSMNGYMPLPPQLYLKYNYQDPEKLANGLTYEKLISPTIKSIEKHDKMGYTSLHMEAKNGVATAFFNSKSFILDSVSMSYIPIDVATNVKEKLSVVFKNERKADKIITFNFSHLKKADRPLEIWNQSLTGQELKRGDHLDMVEDFELTSDNTSINFKELLQDQHSIISIWNIDFNPCIWNIRDFNKLQKKMSTMHKDLNFVSIYIPFKEREQLSKDVEKFNRIYNIQIPTHYLATETEQSFTRKLKLNTYPVYIVIDKKGNILNTYQGYDTTEIIDMERDIKEMYDS